MVKRYDSDLGPWDEGEWVRYQDYAALEAECERLRDFLRWLRTDMTYTAPETVGLKFSEKWYPALEAALARKESP